MSPSPDARSRIDAIEAAIHRDVGRNTGALQAAARGGLARATLALADSPAPRIGLITGFFIPGGEVPAAETDGPAGAALLARGFSAAGLACRVMTDSICASACAAALAAADAPVAVDAVAPGADPAAAVRRWRDDGIDWVIAIERSGPARDGVPRNMRGEAIGDHVAALHEVFAAGPWRTLAIGDGGNEIGMGSLPPGLVADGIAHGERIACVVPADHLVVAGVSHWGAYALLGSLALIRSEWASAMVQALNPALDLAVVAAMVARGPAVDGVTRRRTATIDGLDMDAHHAVLDAVRQIVGHVPDG